MTAPTATSAPRPVRTRLTLTRETAVDRGSAGWASADEAERLRAVFDHQRREARELAELYDTLAPLAEGVAAPGFDLEMGAEFTHAVAVALRTTPTNGEAILHDTSLTVEYLPRVHERLREGVLPVAWHRRILRVASGMDPRQRAALDQHLAQWDLEHVGLERFRTELRYLAAWITAEVGETPVPEDPQPSVDLLPDTQNDGSGCMIVTASSPELRSYTHRLDGAARAVQAAQKAALERGDAIPHDPEGEVARTGRPMSLARLRTRLLLTAQFDLQGVALPADRFRVNVTVPVLTLLGLSDAPALLEGQSPVPARLARRLAAECPDWYRVLTDPATGAFQPLPAQRYVPTGAMREHLRLLNSTCAAPGCIRSTLRGAEADHIEPFDYADPEHGGRTSIENLHLLCRWHHQRKTARQLRPERFPDTVAPPAAGPQAAATSPRSTRPAATPPSATPPTASHPAVGPTSTTWGVGPDRAGVRTTTVTDRDPGTVFSLRDLLTLPGFSGFGDLITGRGARPPRRRGADSG
ncbi:HNH endonuclease [Brachybacterium sp. EF45031]|uniref:HNH endonuclease signature motif containing protein n=1 Tax=Brachybacterium sillae TaxID=2810536 RepID=UPI00217D3536|nr:HNH endonuclease signature motif containing protein [Brachybacterium sillae]MCS6712116.1 HNH endonuclease [Brachybacterium sillae]